MRRTKIICTIGPSSQDEDMLRKIILAGMNVARFMLQYCLIQEVLKSVCATLQKAK